MGVNWGNSEPVPGREAIIVTHGGFIIKPSWVTQCAPLDPRDGAHRPDLHRSPRFEGSHPIHTCKASTCSRRNLCRQEEGLPAEAAPEEKPGVRKSKRK